MEVRCVSTTQIILEINSSFEERLIALHPAETGARSKKGFALVRRTLRRWWSKRYVITWPDVGRVLRPSQQATKSSSNSTLKGLLSNSGQSNSI